MWVMPLVIEAINNKTCSTHIIESFQLPSFIIRGKCLRKFCNAELPSFLYGTPKQDFCDEHTKRYSKYHGEQDKYNSGMPYQNCTFAIFGSFSLACHVSMEIFAVQFIHYTQFKQPTRYGIKRFFKGGVSRHTNTVGQRI